MQNHWIVWLSLFTCLVVIGAAGWRLSRYGAILAETTGLSASWIVLILLATATSLPELVAAITFAPEAAVRLSALRIGAVDMAIANLLVSNLFNIVILAIDDVFYAHGPLLAAVNPSHAITALTVVMMRALVIVGLIYRPQGRDVAGLSWISVGCFLLYLLNNWLLFQYGH